MRKQGAGPVLEMESFSRPASGCLCLIHERFHGLPNSATGWYPHIKTCVLWVRFQIQSTNGSSGHTSWDRIASLWLVGLLWIYLPPQKFMLGFQYQAAIGGSSPHEELFENGKPQDMHMQYTSLPDCMYAHWTMGPLGTQLLFSLDVSFSSTDDASLLNST